MQSSKRPFINTHAHIFTIKNVPPFIAKSFIPWPFYFLFHISFVYGVYRVVEWVRKYYRTFKKARKLILNFIETRVILFYFFRLLSLLLLFNIAMYVLEVIDIENLESIVNQAIKTIGDSVLSPLLFYKYHSKIILAIFFIVFFFYPGIWLYMYSLVKKLFSFVRFIPSKSVVDIFKRYSNIIRFATYTTQGRIYNKLIKMYEPGSKVVILPMDMAYMKAGKTKQPYLEQLEEINNFFVNDQAPAQSIIPFVFVDPRRIRGVKGKEFFDWEIGEKEEDGVVKKFVKLRECLLKKYLEKDGEDSSTGNFRGIKLYPALGYYPFDEDLLALYYYCVDNKLPIVTHCVKGTMFYRGRMLKAWNKHPVFKMKSGKPLDLRQKSNFEMQVNFTHPLNYLVLLESKYLFRVIKKSKNKKLQGLFDFNEATKHVSDKLKALQINIAHYGGVDEWEKYLNQDRNEVAFELKENPDSGITFTTSQSSGIELLSKPAHLFRRKADWFSIISSMMLQYENVYSDISYILHVDHMMPLLNDMLINNEKLSRKILYGTDFFVVRNHKSEKQLYSDLLSIIGEEKMDLIARDNPAEWLNRK